MVLGEANPSIPGRFLNDRRQQPDHLETTAFREYPGHHRAIVSRGTHRLTPPIPTSAASTSADAPQNLIVIAALGTGHLCVAIQPGVPNVHLYAIRTGWRLVPEKLSCGLTVRNVRAPEQSSASPAHRRPSLSRGKQSSRHQRGGMSLQLQLLELLSPNTRAKIVSTCLR